MANKFYVDKLDELKGYVIHGGVTDQNEEMFGLLISLAGERKVLWILMDDEGNGAGSFDIQEVM